MRPRARQRILDFLGQRPMSSAAQIGRGLGMAVPAVRHHLAILLQDGRLKLAPAATPGVRRGRPALRYGLSDRLLGNNLAMIADGLLTAWRGSSMPGAALGSSAPEALARTLVSRLGQLKGARAASRIATLTQQFNVLHYRSRWEAGAAGPRLIFGHCPYSAVIADHPELCQMDALAISRVTGSTAQQVTKIDASAAGVTQCVFSLQATAPQGGRIKSARTKT